MTHNEKACNVQTNLCYILAESASVMVREVERRLRIMGKGFVHEKKMRFSQLLKKMTDVKCFYEDNFTKLVWDADRRAERNDEFRKDASDIALLAMLFADKCGESADNRRQLMDFMMKLPSSLKVFTREDYDEIVMK